MSSTARDPDAPDTAGEKAGRHESAPAVPPPSANAVGADATGAKALSLSRPLYSLPQTGWTRRLCVQMAVYCGVIALSMLAGGVMPIWLDRTDAWGTYRRRAQAEREAAAAAAARDAALLSFCPRPAEAGSSSSLPAWRNQMLARGSPPPPLQVAEVPPAAAAAAPNTTPRLVDASARARAIALRGVSWPGFDRLGAGFLDNIGPKAPSTLAATAGGGGGSGNSSSSGGATPPLPPSGLADAAALIYQLRLLGFNAVRVPFNFDALSDALRAPPVIGWAVPCRREGCGELARRATDPAADVAGLKFFTAPGPAVPLDGEDEVVEEDAEQQQQQQRRRRRMQEKANEEEPSPPSPPPEPPLCNARVPPPADASTRDRMLWLVRLLVGNGFYVVLDEQPQQQQRGGPVPPPAVAEIQQQQQWAALWRSVACLPNFAADLRGRVLLAPAGEPTGSLLETMDAVEEAAPGTGALFLVPAEAATESSFFRELAGRAYADRAVLATSASDDDGSLEAAGVCATAAAPAADAAPSTERCRRFPVLLADVGAGDAASVAPSKAEVAQLRAAGEAMQRVGASGWFWSPWTAITTTSKSKPAAVAVGSLFDFPQSGATFSWPRLRLLLAGEGGLPGFGLAPWYREPKEFAARQAAAAEAARWRRVRDEEPGGGRRQQAASSSWLWGSKGAAGARARGGD